MNISPIWGPLSKAMHGFIVPGTRYFLALGSNGGVHSGIGYKITQDDGNICGGQCPYEAGDIYNYFWLFNIDDMRSAENPWDVRPVSYGKWSHPYDNGGRNRVLGATFDDTTSTLYLSVKDAARVGQYDRPPMIIAYELFSKD
jgi:hypothetical protein